MNLGLAVGLAASAPKYEEMLLDRAGITRFKHLPGRAEWCKFALTGMRYENLLPPGDFTPRRILDLGCQEGAFACWATRKWPRAWIDLVEEDETMRALALENMPPGASMLSIEKGVARLRLEDYQLVRVGMDPGRHWEEFARVKGLVVFDYWTFTEKAAK